MGNGTRLSGAIEKRKNRYGLFSYNRIVKIGRATKASSLSTFFSLFPCHLIY